MKRNPRPVSRKWRLSFGKRLRVMFVTRIRRSKTEHMAIFAGLVPSISNTPDSANSRIRPRVRACGTFVDRSSLAALIRLNAPARGTDTNLPTRLPRADRDIVRHRFEVGHDLARRRQHQRVRRTDQRNDVRDGHRPLDRDQRAGRGRDELADRTVRCPTCLVSTANVDSGPLTALAICRGSVTAEAENSRPSSISTGCARFTSGRHYRPPRPKRRSTSSRTRKRRWRSFLPGHAPLSGRGRLSRWSTFGRPRIASSNT